MTLFLLTPFMIGSINNRISCVTNQGVVFKGLHLIESWCEDIKYYQKLLCGILFSTQDIGVTKVGHIKRILQAIKDLERREMERPVSPERSSGPSTSGMSS